MLINFKKRFCHSILFSPWPEHHFIIHRRGCVSLSSRNQIIVLNTNIAHRLCIGLKVLVGIIVFAVILTVIILVNYLIFDVTAQILGSKMFRHVDVFFNHKLFILKASDHGRHHIILSSAYLSGGQRFLDHLTSKYKFFGRAWHEEAM